MTSFRKEGDIIISVCAHQVPKLVGISSVTPKFDLIDQEGTWHKLRVRGWELHKILKKRALTNLTYTAMPAAKHKLLLFFVSKNACTLLRSVMLALNGLKVEDADEVSIRQFSLIYLRHPFIGRHPTFKNYFKFGFVRNPWDRLVSCYENRIVRTREHDDMQSLLAREVFWTKYPNHDFENMSFAEFVQMVVRIPERSWYCDEHFKSQHRFFAGQRMDFLGRFEYFQRDFSALICQLGLPERYIQMTERVYNKSRRSHYTEYYDDRTRYLVAQRYAKDLRLFGYKYGD